MDKFAAEPAEIRAELFTETAARMGVSPQIIEKDFWVCWTLRRVFSLKGPLPGLIFKGGISLSKAYGLIERFSEDIDLSLDRHDLGFAGERDLGINLKPLQSKSKHLARREHFGKKPQYCICSITKLKIKPWVSVCLVIITTWRSSHNLASKIQH